MPRTPQTIEKLKEARRAQILVHALRLFAINGYDATSINDIADAIGCSHGLIYHYFDDKEAIFTTLLDNALALGYMPVFPSLGPTELADPLGTMTSIVTHIFAELDREESDFAHYFYLFLNMRFQKTAPLPRFHVPQRDQRPFGIILTLVREGQLRGAFELQEPRDLAVSFFALMRGLTYVKLHEGSKFALPPVATVMNLFARKVV